MVCSVAWKHSDKLSTVTTTELTVASPCLQLFRHFPSLTSLSVSGTCGTPSLRVSDFCCSDPEHLSISDFMADDLRVQPGLRELRWTYWRRTASPLLETDSQLILRCFPNLRTLHLINGIFTIVRHCCAFCPLVNACLCA